MNNTIIAEPVVSQPEDPLPAPEEPLLPSGAERAPHDAVAPCTHDCRTCMVQVLVHRMNQPHRMGRKEAADMQHRFNRQAFGFVRPCDEYTRRLDQREESLSHMSARIAGCDKAVNGTRLMVYTMLEHAKHELDEDILSEQKLYIPFLGSKNAPVLPEAEYTPPRPPENVMQKIIKRFR